MSTRKTERKRGYGITIRLFRDEGTAEVELKDCKTGEKYTEYLDSHSLLGVIDAIQVLKVRFRHAINRTN